MEIILKLTFVIIAVYLISVLGLYLFQEKFIFKNVKLDKDYIFSFKQDFEEIDLKTDDGHTINSLLFKVKDPKGVILFFHGNRGCLKRWGNIVSMYEKYNYDVFVIDYRSYGKSTGKFNEKMMYKDAVQCYDFIKERYGEENIVIYGRSLGTTFATKTASSRNPRLLILEAPFYNIRDIINYHYPLLTTDFLLKYKFRTDKYIPNVRSKVVIFHGKKDRLIPISSSKKLKEKINKKKLLYITCPTGTHDNLTEFDEYNNTMRKLLE